MKTTKAPKKSKIRPEGDVVTVAGKTATIIRQVKTVGGREYVTFRARYWQDGQRKEITAPDIETAQQRARDALKHHESGSGHVMQFKPAEAANVAAAVAKLQEVGVPLLIAVADYVAARKALPSKWTVADAARGFAVFKAKEEAEAAGPKEMRFIDAVAKFHERNDKRGLSEASFPAGQLARDRRWTIAPLGAPRATGSCVRVARHRDRRPMIPTARHPQPVPIP